MKTKSISTASGAALALGTAFLDVPNVKPSRQPRSNPQEVQKTLSETNWEKYCEKVDRRVAQEVDAFEVARARSLEAASQQVFL